MSEVRLILLSVQGLEQPLRAANAPVFQCTKAEGPIPIRNRLVRDALIQMALDPEVTQIRPPEANERSFDFRATRCGVEERISVRSNSDEGDETADGDCDVISREPPFSVSLG